MELFWVNQTGITQFNHSDNPNGFLWINCHADTIRQNTREWQTKIAELSAIDIHELHLEDILNKSHPSGFESTATYEFLIINSLVLHTSVDEPLEHAKNILSGSQLGMPHSPIGFLIGKNILITTYHENDHLEFIKNFIQNTVSHTSNAATSLFIKSIPKDPLNLCLAIINSLVDRYLLLRQHITMLIDNWQRELLTSHRDIDNWHTLLNARMTLRHLENLSEDQYDAIQELNDTIIYSTDKPTPQRYAGNTEHERIRINDLLNHIERVQTHAARMESVIENAIQLHFSATANRTNEIIRVMTIITVIFTPLTLVASIFGMNFQHMPLLANYYGFWLTLGGMISVAFILIAWALTRKYIRKHPNIDLHKLSHSLSLRHKK